MKILSICGSPRKGNSETILLRIQALLKKKGIENEIILLRKKEINRCRGCVEYCNNKLKCQIKDDMPEIMAKMEKAAGFVFISPNYFKMPTGLFKDFIDRCSVFYTAGKEKLFKMKKAIVICVGTDNLEGIDVCTHNIAENFCKTLGLQVVGRKSFRSRSELKGNSNDIFENNLNPNINKDLQRLVDLLV
ncbi:flavodoxin family protein [Candidatus Microgenomates bacterium]|nr:flavodoxin family protein [Candidatus Microgenomates bacterium]